MFLQELNNELISSDKFMSCILFLWFLQIFMVINIFSLSLSLSLSNGLVLSYLCIVGSQPFMSRGVQTLLRWMPYQIRGILVDSFLDVDEEHFIPVQCDPQQSLYRELRGKWQTVPTEHRDGLRQHLLQLAPMWLLRHLQQICVEWKWDAARSQPPPIDM